jgi:hypothetical protein
MAKSKKQKARDRRSIVKVSDARNLVPIALKARPTVNLEPLLPEIESCLREFRQSYRADQIGAFDPKTGTVTFSEFPSENDLRQGAKILSDAADVYDYLTTQSPEMEKRTKHLREDSALLEARASSKRRPRKKPSNSEVGIEGIAFALMALWQRAGGKFYRRSYGPLVEFVSTAMRTVKGDITTEAAGHLVRKIRSKMFHEEREC